MYGQTLSYHRRAPYHTTKRFPDWTNLLTLKTTDGFPEVVGFPEEEVIMNQEKIIWHLFFSSLQLSLDNPHLFICFPSPSLDLRIICGYGIHLVTFTVLVTLGASEAHSIFIIFIIQIILEFLLKNLSQFSLYTH